MQPPSRSATQVQRHMAAQHGQQSTTGDQCPDAHLHGADLLALVKLICERAIPLPLVLPAQQFHQAHLGQPHSTPASRQAKQAPPWRAAAKPQLTTQSPPLETDPSRLQASAGPPSSCQRLHISELTQRLLHLQQGPPILGALGVRGDQRLHVEQGVWRLAKQTCYHMRPTRPTDAYPPCPARGGRSPGGESRCGWRCTRQQMRTRPAALPQSHRQRYRHPPC